MGKDKRFGNCLECKFKKRNKDLMRDYCSLLGNYLFDFNTKIECKLFKRITKNDKKFL